MIQRSIEEEKFPNSEVSRIFTILPVFWVKSEKDLIRILTFSQIHILIHLTNISGAM